MSSLSYRVAVGVLLSFLPRVLYAEPVHAQPVSEKPRAPEVSENPPAPAIGEDETLYSCKNRTGKVRVTFKPETELKDLVAWVMGFTCKNFVLDPRIVSTGKKVTLIVPNEMSAADAYRVFLVALSTIGLTVVPKGKVLRIVESAGAKAQNVPFLKNVLPDASDQVVRYVYRPTYAQAATLQQAFTALKSDAGDIQLIDSIVLITDYGNHVRDMMSLAHLIDVPGGSDGIYTIPVQHADAAKLAEKIGQLLGLPATAPAAGKGAPAAAPRETAAVPSKILVDDRTNTLVLAASEAAYLRVKALVERLDISLDIENGAAMHVYRLGSAISEELAKTLTDAISGNQAKTTAPRPGGPPVPVPLPASPADVLGTSLEGPVRVIADAPTNSLIVMSSGRDFIAIKDIIKQLDQPRRQVYIEAVILEVAVGNSLSAGMSTHGGISTSSGALAIGGVQMPNVSTLNLANLNPSGLLGGIIGSALPGSSALFGKSIPSYGVLFQAMATQNNANVLSAPSIIALDNAEAKYKVGTNIPYKRGQSVGGVGSLEGSVNTNIERQDLLLELNIKPHISIDDSVLLEIKHDSKDLQSGKDSDLGPTWSARSFETRVLVRDQQTVVIGGLMQERETIDQSKVPILGDIPILGHLFKSTTKGKQKTNLLIMLTPYIVKDQMDLEAIRSRKQREQDEFVRSFGTLDRMKYAAKIDYARKRGLVEEINRTVQGIEEDIATRNNFVRPAPVEQGVVAPSPIRDSAHL